MPRKVFTPGEVLAAADVNSFLMDQTIMTFAGTAARGSAIGTATEGMYAHLNDTDTLTYYNGSAWVNRIGASAGILQVVSTAKTDTFSTNSATFTTVTGLTATITPSSTSSKILVMAQVSIGMAPANKSYGHYKVTRGGTDIYIGDAAGSRIQTVFGGYIQSNLNDVLLSNSIIKLDSPSSTSALTYQVEARRGGSADLVYVNRSPGDVDDANFGRGASSITLMEVAG
jgi:hypothetical protein